MKVFLDEFFFAIWMKVYVTAKNGLAKIGLAKVGHYQTSCVARNADGTVHSVDAHVGAPSSTRRIVVEREIDSTVQSRAVGEFARGQCEM